MQNTTTTQGDEMLDTKATEKEILSALRAVESRSWNDDDTFSGYFVYDVVAETDPETGGDVYEIHLERKLDSETQYMALDNGLMNLSDFKSESDFGDYAADVSEYFTSDEEDMLSRMTETQREVIVGLSEQFGVTVRLVEMPLFTGSVVQEYYEKFVQEFLSGYEVGDDTTSIEEIAGLRSASVEQRAEAREILAHEADRQVIFTQLAKASFTLDPKDLSVVARRDDLDLDIIEHIGTIESMLESA